MPFTRSERAKSCLYKTIKSVAEHMPIGSLVLNRDTPAIKKWLTLMSNRMVTSSRRNQVDELDDELAGSGLETTTEIPTSRATQTARERERKGRLPEAKCEISRAGGEARAREKRMDKKAKLLARGRKKVLGPGRHVRIGFSADLAHRLGDL